MGQSLAPLATLPFALSVDLPLMLAAHGVRGFYLHMVVVGAIIFALGVVGFLTRRNLIVVFLCTEVMFQGIILTLVGYSLKHMDPAGQAFSLFLLVIAAAEAALALALVVLLFRRRGTLDAEAFAMLRG